VSTDLTVAQSVQRALAQFARKYPEVKFEKAFEYRIPTTQITIDIGKLKFGHTTYFATLPPEVGMLALTLLVCRFGDAHIEPEELLNMPCQHMTSLISAVTSQLEIKQ
jgi:hypothetical protein